MKNPQPEEKLDRLAGIEYAGLPGVSKDCQDAILRLIQYGSRVTHAKILSSAHDHCLLLAVDCGNLVAVKSGFASGYGGEGPRTFSYVLQVLETHGAEIDEYIVSPDLLDRIDASAVTVTDLKTIDKSSPRRPSQWHDYVSEEHWERAQIGWLWEREFPAVVPYAIVDSRLADLALSFWDGPDDKLMLGYRRLEDIVRKRTGIEQHGVKLFSQAFNPTGGQLTWSDADDGERTGRMNLFTGAWMAHRNRRAHRELSSSQDDLLAEFLLLNHLYRLERDAIPTEASPT
jgi:hypothetical protein